MTDLPTPWHRRVIPRLRAEGYRAILSRRLPCDTLTVWGAPDSAPPDVEEARVEEQRVHNPNDGPPDRCWLVYHERGGGM